MSVILSFYLTPFPWTNLRAKYIYGFLLTGRRYSVHFKAAMWEFLEKVFYHNLKSVLPNIMLCVLPNMMAKSVLPNMMSCVLPNIRLCDLPNMKALKPTHTRRANIMGPKAPNTKYASLLKKCLFPCPAQTKIFDGIYSRRWHGLSSDWLERVKAAGCPLQECNHR